MTTISASLGSGNYHRALWAGKWVAFGRVMNNRVNCATAKMNSGLAYKFHYERGKQTNEKKFKKQGQALTQCSGTQGRL